MTAQKTTGDRRNKQRVISGRYTSPFRYPGGKTWFLPTARKWLSRCCNTSTQLIEPFAGGAGISLAAAQEKLVGGVTFAEIDRDVAATWATILNGHAKWLANEILNFRISRARVKDVLAQTPSSEHERAFQCLLKNRMSRGGVLHSNAGLLRRGEEGRGLRSRWYPEALAARIEAISAMRDDLDFRQDDGLQVIRDFIDDPSAAFFVDPPYTKAARRLYSCWKIDHEGLFRLLSEARGPVLMTYDDTAEVRRWAVDAGFTTRRISMKTTHHETKKELIISRDFKWLQ